MALRTREALLIIEQLAPMRHIAIVGHGEIAKFFQGGWRDVLLLRRRVLAKRSRLEKDEGQNAERNNHQQSGNAPFRAQDHRPSTRLSADYSTYVQWSESITVCTAASRFAGAS